MKKIIFTLALIATLASGKATVHGDVNCDGTVTASDVTALYNYILFNDMTYAGTSDVNGDNTVTGSDVTDVYNVILFQVEPKKGKIYINDNAGWGDMALYAWPEAGLTPWPGIHHSGIVSHGGKNYYQFDLSDSYYDKALNYIANNYGAATGITNRQLDLMSDYKMGESDIYISVSNDGYTIDNDEIPPGEVIVPGETQPLDVDFTTAVSEKNRVIYEMNVGSFTSAGTFVAAQAKLNDLRKLGIDIVWLMPIYPRGGGINSPYAATNFKAVNPSYGSISDLRNFVSRAHELGMQVILDWVPNHTATNAVWVTEHPEYYTTQNGSMVHPNNYGDVYQLNYGNPSLCEAMNDCLRYWIDQANVDGYRCDYVSSSAIPSSYWASTIPMLRDYAPDKNLIMLAETDIVHDATRLLNVGFDYDYAWNFQSGKLQRFGPNGTSGNTLRNYCESFINESQGLSFDRMTYLTNHDQNFNDGGKTMENMYGANKYALTTLFFTIYGMPLLYNGQEVGNDQILNYFQDTKINWNNNDAMMTNTIRTLVALRHTQPALACGTATTFLSTNSSNVLAYTKTSGDNTVLIILNLGNTETSVTIGGIEAGTYRQWLNSATVATALSSNLQTLAPSSTFSVPAKGYSVLVKQ